MTLPTTSSAPSPTWTLDDFDYILPDALIARHPLAQRSASRLLHVAADGTLHDQHFTDLPTLLSAGDLLILNDTKVMNARLFGQKASGGAVEVLVERILSPDLSHNPPQYRALCHVRASRAPKAGQTLELAEGHIRVTVMGREANLFVLDFAQPIAPLLTAYGSLPIPPYFERMAEAEDDTRYQTVFHDPNKTASVAAPTASLHFDEALLQQLADQGVQRAFVTLHVGAGTFAPVKTNDISQHQMHSEYAELPADTAALINATKAAGGRVIAVGTTVTRVLETAYRHTQPTQDQNAPLQLQAWAGDTDIFIYPPYRFGVIDRLITNFHLPKSTLLMLVSALAGRERMLAAYQHAIDAHYRFFSYGDAMLIDKVTNQG